MARFSESGKMIRFYIKKQLAARRMSYRDLARKIGASELTVKRMMTSQDMKLETLIKIGEVLGFSLMDWVYADFIAPEQFGYYSEEQEEYLADDPLAALVFLKLAMGRSPERAQEEAGLSRTMFLRKLRKLDELGLMELWPEEKIRVRLKGPFRFRENGRFMKHLFPQLREQLFSHFRLKFDAISESPRPGKAGVFRPFEIYLRRETAQQLSRNLMSLLGKYRQISNLEHSNGYAVEPVAGIIGVDTLDAWKNIFLKAASTP